MQNTLFSGVQKHVSTSLGDVALPIFYYDVSLVQAFYLVDKKKVAPMLYGTGLLPVSTFRNQAVVGISFFEYRDTSIGAYNEAGLGVAVKPAYYDSPPLGLLELLKAPRKRHIGFYVLDLPVTTNAACTAGRELWGYPKFVTDIPFRLDDNGFVCSVANPRGGNIFTISGKAKRGISLPVMELLLYSNLRGKHLRTVVDIEAKAHSTDSRGFQLELAERDHPMAVRLRELGLADKRPALIQTTSRFQSRLNPGEVCGIWQAPPIPYADEPATPDRKS